jgi:hypothetical protein
MDSGEMPRDEDDAGGDDLHALFERERPHVSEQPFVNDIARRVSAARRRRTFATRAAHVVALGALIGASRWLLVPASELLSTKLEELFSHTASALDSPLSHAASAFDSPYGYGAGILCLLAAALVFRRRLFR